MHSFSLTAAALVLPSFFGLPSTISAFAAAPAGASTTGGDCHGKVCHAIEEYCSTFIEGCDKCANICEPDTHNYHADDCARQCREYKKYDPLQAEIHTIQTQQCIILVLLGILLGLIAIRYACICIRWLRNKHCITLVLKKLQPKQHAAQGQISKDLGATTISNGMAINDIERAASQIYSVTGAEGSVMTMTTPVSTRYPAENSTPTTVATEYSYDNQALAITPVSEKPNSTQAF